MTERDVSVAAEEDPAFRSGVGILLFNAAGQVFAGQRRDLDTPAWQAPQGGIDPGETPLEAALRELREEIGVERVEVLGETQGWLRYEYPPDVVQRPSRRHWRGQQQKWFAMRLVGPDDDIDLISDHPEFSAWRWVAVGELTRLIVPFKRAVYGEVARRFAAFAAP